MIVQFTDEKLLGLLLVAEAEQRIIAGTRQKSDQITSHSKEMKKDTDRLPLSFLREVIPHV